ncbi:uncharacterized protein LOC114457837 [Gouania willdenowi]|uniref:Uncharacterized LOC114457837 n=1 Tax=Gouania willdenowi TaxID=441366 RepID=A0A8C5I0N2_GOUWI|nr:uncharacterized protein LOC114457837 [Gouania willdenowi]XP_028295750.1 uncharacterized protein LOC114457837 [Gouania willdenowi]
MPAPRAAALLQVALLISAVPAQYFISRWIGSTAAQRYHATTRLLRWWREWKSYLCGSWVEWANLQLSKVTFLIGLGEDEPVEQHLHHDKLVFGNDEGFFGAYKEVRSPRPPFVFLRVGDVVMEVKGHNVGVVVSWDSERRVPPEEWPDQETTPQKTPYYKVLFRGTDPSHDFKVGYYVQTSLKRLTGVKPHIPILERYFTHFNGRRFIMQPWLRAIFPDDANEDEDEEENLHFP